MYKTTKLISLILIIPFVFSMCNNPNTEKVSEDNEPNVESISEVNFTPDLPINEESTTVEFENVSGYFDFEKIPDNEYRIFADIDYDNKKVKIAIPKININDELVVYKGVYSEIENEWKFIIDIKSPEFGEEDVFSSTSYFEIDIDSFNQISSVLIRVFNDDEQTIKYLEKEIIKQSTFSYSGLSETALSKVKNLEESPEDFFGFYNNEDAIFLNSIIENTDTTFTVNLFELAYTQVSVYSIKYDNADKDLVIEISVSSGDSIENGMINHYSFTIKRDYYINAENVKVVIRKGNEKTSKTIGIERKR